MKWEYHKGKSKYISTKLTKPKINVDIIHGDRRLWDVFKKHHYLSEDLPLSTRCFFAVWDDNIIGFSATISCLVKYLLYMKAILERNGENAEL